MGSPGFSVPAPHGPDRDEIYRENESVQRLKWCPAKIKLDRSGHALAIGQRGVDVLKQASGNTAIRNEVGYGLGGTY